MWRGRPAARERRPSSAASTSRSKKTRGGPLAPKPPKSTGQRVVAGGAQGLDAAPQVEVGAAPDQPGVKEKDGAAGPARGRGTRSPPACPAHTAAAPRGSRTAPAARGGSGCVTLASRGDRARKQPIAIRSSRGPGRGGAGFFSIAARLAQALARIVQSLFWCEATTCLTFSPRWIFCAP